MLVNSRLIDSRKEEKNDRYNTLPSMVSQGSRKFTGIAPVDAKQSFCGKNSFLSERAVETAS